MFKNAGRKIKGFAKIEFCLSVIGIIISAIILVRAGTEVQDGEYLSAFILSAVIIVIFGVLYAWILTIMLYGYGELIDSNQRIANSVEKNNSL